MLRKIDADTNVLTWFELPVLDTQRAKTFYETLLGIDMTTRAFPDTGEELTFFPSHPGVIQATSGRVTGALVRSGASQPSLTGTLVYLNASPVLQTVLDRVEAAGGAVLQAATPIPAGFIAVIRDTEGNRIALHAEK